MLECVQGGQQQAGCALRLVLSRKEGAALLCLHHDPDLTVFAKQETGEKSNKSPDLNPGDTHALLCFSISLPRQDKLL